VSKRGIQHWRRKSPVWVGTVELADLFCVHRDTILKWTKSGKLREGVHFVRSRETSQRRYFWPAVKEDFYHA